MTLEEIVDEMDDRWRAEVVQEGEKRGIVVWTMRRDTLDTWSMYLAGVLMGLWAARVMSRG